MPGMSVGLRSAVANCIVNVCPAMPSARAGASSTGVHRFKASSAAATNCLRACSSPFTSIAVACGGPMSDPSRFRLKFSVTDEFVVPAGGCQHARMALPTSPVVVAGSASAAGADRIFPDLVALNRELI